MLRSMTNPGYTLIEAVLAIAMLLIGIIATMQLFPLSLQLVSDSRDITTATNLGVAALEELATVDYEDLTVGIYEEKGRLSEDSTSYLYQYQRMIDISYVDSSMAPSATDQGLKKIDVTLYWSSPLFESEESTTLSTVKANF